MTNPAAPPNAAATAVRSCLPSLSLGAASSEEGVSWTPGLPASPSGGASPPLEVLPGAGLTNGCTNVCTNGCTKGPSSCG